MHDFKEEPHLDVDQANQVANYGRKLLEAFFSFKHPKARNDFYGEGENITQLIFDIVKKSDKAHFDEMRGVCKN